YYVPTLSLLSVFFSPLPPPPRPTLFPYTTLFRSIDVLRSTALIDEHAQADRAFLTQASRRRRVHGLHAIRRLQLLSGCARFGWCRRDRGFRSRHDDVGGWRGHLFELQLGHRFVQRHHLLDLGLDRLDFGLGLGYRLVNEYGLQGLHQNRYLDDACAGYEPIDQHEMQSDDRNRRTASRQNTRTRIASHRHIFSPPYMTGGSPLTYKRVALAKGSECRPCLCRSEPAHLEKFHIN